MTTTTGGVLGAARETQSSAGARSDSARRLGSSGTEVPIWHRSGNSPVGQSTWPSDGHSTPKGRPQNDKDMTSRRAGPSARFCSSAPQPHHAEEVARTSLAGHIGLPDPLPLRVPGPPPQVHEILWQNSLAKPRFRLVGRAGWAPHGRETGAKRAQIGRNGGASRAICRTTITRFETQTLGSGLQTIGTTYIHPYTSIYILLHPYPPFYH